MLVNAGPVACGPNPLSPNKSVRPRPATPASKTRRRRKRVRDFGALSIIAIISICGRACRPARSPRTWRVLPYRPLSAKLNFGKVGKYGQMKGFPGLTPQSTRRYDGPRSSSSESCAYSAGVSFACSAEAGAPLAARRRANTKSAKAPITRMAAGATHNIAVCAEKRGLSRTNSP